MGHPAGRRGGLAGSSRRLLADFQDCLKIDLLVSQAQGVGCLEIDDGGPKILQPGLSGSVSNPTSGNPDVGTWLLVLVFDDVPTTGRSTVVCAGGGFDFDGAEDEFYVKIRGWLVFVGAWAARDGIERGDGHKGELVLDCFSVCFGGQGAGAEGGAVLRDLKKLREVDDRGMDFEWVEGDFARTGSGALRADVQGIGEAKVVEAEIGGDGRGVRGAGELSDCGVRDGGAAEGEGCEAQERTTIEFHSNLR